MRAGDLIRVATLEGLARTRGCRQLLGRVGVIVEDEGGALVNFKSSECWMLCLIEGRLYMLPTRCMINLQKVE